MNVPRYISNKLDIDRGIPLTNAGCPCGAMESEIIGETPMEWGSPEESYYTWTEKHKCSTCDKIYWMNNGT